MTDAAEQTSKDWAGNICAYTLAWRALSIAEHFRSRI
jgi:hypothetical protein